MKITHQIGDRVKVLHNIPLGNLIGTVKAIHSRPKHDVYDVELDGGGTDSLYAEQLERITDTPALRPPERQESADSLGGIS